MRAWVLSDLHADSMRPFDIGAHPECDVILMPGDLANTHEARVEWLLAILSADERAKLIFVPGNHEAFGVGLDGLDESMQRLADQTGIRVLRNEAIELVGHRIVGSTLWTALAPSLDRAFAMGTGDFGHIPDFTPADWRAQHLWDRDYLVDTVRPGDIVVTHHAPAFESLSEAMQLNLQIRTGETAYYTDLEAVIRTLRPALWVHGHTHSFRDYAIGETRIVSNARGRGLGRHFQPGFVVELPDPSPKLQGGPT